MVGIISFYRDLALSSSAFTPVTAAAEGALYLLTGETQGFSIDATTYDTDTAAAYVGGPVGGTVAVIDTGTPANNLSNVALDSSNLVQSGTSAKMVHFPSSPYVRWSPHNLQINSEAMGTGWSTSDVTVTSNSIVSPDGTTTADLLTEGTVGNAQLIGQSTTVSASTTYTASAYVKTGNLTWLRMQYVYTSGGADVEAWFNLATGAAGTLQASGTATAISSSITAIGNSWYRVTITGIIGANTSARMVFLSANADASGTHVNNATYYVWGAQICRGYNANPYLVTTSAARIGIPQSYDTAASKYGILVEPAATNLMPGSSTTGWAFSNATGSANATSPEGVANSAMTVTADVGTDGHAIRSNVTHTSANAHTYSCYIKQGTTQYVGLAVGGNSGTTDMVGAVWDLSDGTLEETKNGSGSGTVASTSITSIGNGWYRCTLTSGTGLVSASAMSVFPATANPNTWVASSAIPMAQTGGSQTVLTWGAQVETGSVATSYIPTLGSSVTRAADQVIVSHSLYPFSTTVDTIYLDVKDLFPNFSEALLILGTSNNGTPYVFGASTGVYGGAGLNTLIDTSLNTRWQVSAVFKNGDNANSSDGGVVQTNSDATALASNTPTGIGCYGNIATRAADEQSIIYRVVIVPRRVSNADLPTWRYNF